MESREAGIIRKEGQPLHLFLIPASSIPILDLWCVRECLYPDFHPSPDPLQYASQ